MVTKRTAATLAGLGLVLALSGCSSSGSGDANAAWCQGAAKVQSEVDKMASLVEEGSPTDLVKAQWGAVQAAIEANSVPLSQLEDSTQQEISAAYGALTTSLEAIPADLPPSEAAPQLKAAVDTFNADIQSVEADICS